MYRQMRICQEGRIWVGVLLLFVFGVVGVDGVEGVEGSVVGVVVGVVEGVVDVEPLAGA
jgi:hypothetical protein